MGKTIPFTVAAVLSALLGTTGIATAIDESNPTPPSSPAIRGNVDHGKKGVHTKKNELAQTQEQLRRGFPYGVS